MAKMAVRHARLFRAGSRGVSLNRQEQGTTALAAHDAEIRFRVAAAGANRRGRARHSGSAG
ncbi:hypothetical protein P7L64_19890 [Tistrella bauzanensis]|uniref:hypothetical protein n=1 Tax=Tistrella bauzanensis TaxID=657419 RepID=UPI00166D1DAC|nr:hypothetical protein [Tistrella bauzanensis]